MVIKINSVLNNKYPDIITPFQPIFIKTHKYTKDVFQKEFPDIMSEKENILLKFANINEFLNQRLLASFHIDILNSFSLKKLINIYPIANLKASGMSRFSAEELINVLRLSNDDITFLKPFARQKSYNGLFNFSVDELMQMSKYSKDEKARLMDLSNTRLGYRAINTLVKDKRVDTNDVAGALRKLQDEFAENIESVDVLKTEDGYKIKILSKEPYKIHVFPYKEGNAVSKMTQERFMSISSINEKIDEIIGLNHLVNIHNAEVINTNRGKIKNYVFNLPPNLIRNEWEAGKLAKEDITMFFTEAAGIVSKEDYKYFAEQGFKLTPFDNEKILEARKYSVTHEPLSINSDYHKKLELQVLAKEFEKLENVDTNHKFLIIDGLPGAGKSTVFKSFIKNSDETYYLTDVDDLRSEFPEYYKGGIGAHVVHPVTRHIYKEIILPKAMREGKNIVFQMTGNYESVDKVLQEAYKNGYSIDYINVNVNPAVAINRAKYRHATNGRYIDPYLILDRVRVNNSAKQYMSKILSYSPYINASYEYKPGILTKIEDGVEAGHINLDKSQNTILDKVKAFFSRFI